ncbi:helix-turn-helix transcriptional regulator [Luteipulveratus halotolerans]|uniref:HTH araC/xylS-type domain-containing protein n=1 Tax=Luteipulveratus halotolerans TaxID=1631356 RepID=A0A0L6CL19_9MICO|nr:AraC family transcriptional regulator [Luteipulveratus halotolerans]KNX38442.1 hypothetical protein VV01_16890 [Luteipulveratus halotolerans]
MRDPAIKAAQFLRAHLDEPVTVQDAADHVGYSPFHLTRMFTGTLGVSPVQYVAAHRFQRAKVLLLAGQDPVVDVCMAVGFSSVGTFTRRFVEHVGTSPSAFRRLPDRVADRTPQPVVGSGRGPGRLRGRVTVDAAGVPFVGPRPHVYVGLFARPSTKGTPVSGSFLVEPGRFLLDGVPAGRWWLFAAAVPHDDPVGQLLVPGLVTAMHPTPVEIAAVPQPGPGPAYDLTLSPAPDWVTPLSVALPPLAGLDDLGDGDLRRSS